MSAFDIGPLSDEPLRVYELGIPRATLNRLTDDDKAWIRRQLERVDIEVSSLGTVGYFEALYGRRD